MRGAMHQHRPAGPPASSSSTNAGHRRGVSGRTSSGPGRGATGQACHGDASSEQGDDATRVGSYGGTCTTITCEVTPDMTRPFKGTINIDIKDSVPDWGPYEQPRAPEGAPSVLLIVLD